MRKPDWQREYYTTRLTNEYRAQRVSSIDLAFVISKVAPVWAVVYGIVFVLNGVVL